LQNYKYSNHNVNHRSTRNSAIADKLRSDCASILCFQHLTA